MYAVFFFFFSCYAHHRHLHSFPTRRSSDLLGPRLQGTSCRAVEREQRIGPRVQRLEDGVAAATQQHNTPEHRPRSEEHTSELQSHSDLVCRLLLEKKKTTTNRYTNTKHRRY